MPPGTPGSPAIPGIEVEWRDAVAVVRMRHGKVNAIGPAFLAELGRALDACAAARALVLTADGPTFSAGLDLPLLVDLDREAMRGFMRAFSDGMLRLFELPAPVIAAVNGHAIAGGCVLALQADVRLAADGPGLMGLNETQLGLGLPAVVLHPLLLAIPPASFAPVALEGTLVPPRRALELGLVHEVVPPAELLPRALERAARLAALPPAGVRRVKELARRGVSHRIREDGAAELDRWVDDWFAPETRERVRGAVARLGKGRPQA
ncbi:MAG TPA: enoyl-CoA hydratase/isomerase family protein [Anaeromyxobacteraceae bacterium]|nr:enoyl-CoA hydratase/isomerase family protein [Anaeromyxobacteraceae bacterium]